MRHDGNELWFRPDFCPLPVSEHELSNSKYAVQTGQVPTIRLWLDRAESGGLAYVGYEVARWQRGKPVQLK
jgi:hypothetical protein